MTITEELLIKARADMGELRQEAQKSSRSFSDFAKSAGQFATGVNQGLELIQKAVGGVKKAFETANFANQIRRMEQIVGRDLARTLKAATGGTVTEVDALRAAFRNMTGDMALTRAEMEVVFAAADDLGKRFQEETIVIVDRLSEALRKGETEAFRKYGIAIDITKSKSEQLKQAFKGLQEVAADQTAANKAADSFDQMAAAAQDAMDDIKLAVGDMVRDVILLIGKLRMETAPLRERRGAQRSATQRLGFGFLNTLGDINPTGFGVTPGAALELTASGRQLVNEEQERQRQFSAALQKIIAPVDKVRKERQEAEAKATKGIERFAEGLQKAEKEVDKFRFPDREFSRTFGGAGQIDQLDQLSKNLEPQFTGRFDRGLGPGPKRGFLQDRLLSPLLGQDPLSQSSIDQTSKKLEEIRAASIAAREQEALAATGHVDSMLSSLGAIFGAEKTFARLRAVVKVAEETAMAASAAATGNVPKAIAHGLAAAAWGVVATKAGGGGGGGARPGAGGAPGGGFAAGFGTESGGGGGTIVINVGDGFVGDEHRLAQEIDRKIRGAQRSKRITENNAVRHE